MKAVLKYLKENRRRFVDELCEHVRFPSVSAQPDHAGDLQRCARWLADHCQKIGLETEFCLTERNPIVVARTPRTAGERKPHYLVYGHYDVQPPEPFDLWKTPPFEPVIKGSRLYGRGASDNKGQHLAHLKAAEAYLKTGTPLPCDLTFIIEGEEEVGSESLPVFLKQRRKDLRCAGVVVSDTGMTDKQHPALTYALRGVTAIEITLTGPSRDLHSGIYGGSVKNPAMALSQLLAEVHDANGRVTIPGFYDDVLELSDYERKQMARVPFNRKDYAKFLGVPELFGEAGYSPMEQRSARPTFEINGLTSGYQGAGSKTIVPAKASAKITLRLVPNQKPEKILKLVVNHLKRRCPAGVRMDVALGHGGKPYLVSPTGAQAQAALTALKGAFGCEPVLLREGGSIPIVTGFKDILGVDTLLLGLALPDDNAHSPNEKFDLECYQKGMTMSALLWAELGRIG